MLIVVALAGVVLVSRQPSPGRAPVVAAGVGLALAAALGFGLFVVGLGVAAPESPSWAAATARFASVCTVITVALAATRTSVRCSQRLLPLIVAVGIFDAGANALIAVAATHGSIGHVAVLSALYPVMTILLARALLHEHLGATRSAAG